MTTRDRTTLGVGIHDDVPEDVYHGDTGSLSSTFIRLLTEHVPAKARARANRPATKAMNLGKAVHQRALGKGPELIVWQHDGRTNAGKEERAHYAADIAAEKVVAVTQTELDKIDAMVLALYKHAEVVDILTTSRTEATVYWMEGDIWGRARVDLLGDEQAWDYKTTADASRAGFQKAMAAYGYHQQADWYTRGLKACGHPAGSKPMRFICQETEPPYLVQIHTPDDVARLTAKELNDRAVRLYQTSTAANQWAGYEPLHAEETPLPGYYFWSHEDHLTNILGTDMEIN